MIRLGVFLGLGPLVGLLTIFGFSALIGRVSISVTQLLNILALWPLAYFLGLVPAAIACFADWNARDMHPFGRMGVTTIAGYAATSLSMVMFAKFTVSAEFLIYGLVGVVPAGLCSLIAEMAIRFNGQSTRD